MRTGHCVSFQPAIPFTDRQNRRPHLAGGATDALSRQIGARLSELRGQPVIVENKPGANQIIGAECVAKSAPDGNTLLVSDASSFVINPHLYTNMAYDGRRGFTPITVLVRFPWVVAVHPSVPADTFQELVAYARARPGALSYGSFGLGSSAHISVDYLKKLLGIDIVHVPYKGAGPAVTDLLGGQIQMMMVTPLLVEPHARAGKLRLLAAATRERIARLPGLPTVSESGVAGYEAGTWFALVGARRHAPRGEPRAVCGCEESAERAGVQGEVRRQAVVRNRRHTPEEFAAFLGTEYERWEKVVRLSGVKLE